MATHDDVRRIASKLPGATEATTGRFAFEVVVKGKCKGFAWSWAERVDPKKAKVINDEVLAVRVPNLEAKELILQSDPIKFFTEPHYNGYSAVLIRLDAIDAKELEDLIVEAWRCNATTALQIEYDSSN